MLQSTFHKQPAKCTLVQSALGAFPERYVLFQYTPEKKTLRGVLTDGHT